MHRGVKAFVIGILELVLLTSAFMAGLAAGHFSSRLAVSPTPTPPANVQEERQKAFQLFWEAWDILEQSFYGDLPDPQQAARDAVKGVLQRLNDPNTVLLDPDLARIMSEDISGQFEGIGATVRTDENGFLVIVEPIENSPASRAGLRPGDIVLEVDGESIQGWSTIEAVAKIRGPRGTKVQLLIYRPSTGEQFSVEITRERIDIPTVETRWLEDETIFYLRLREFNSLADDKVREALKEMQKHGAKGLILDLRGNPGGLLDVAVSVGSEFVGQGIIVEERAKNGTTKQYPALAGGLATDPSLPMVVLVNQASASASEIVAGAIQDTGRGLLVGTRTFGKGSVQQVHELSDGSQLRVTIAHWFTPKGRDIHKNGLEPDVQVELSWDEYQAGRDTQLEKALEVLKERIGGGAGSVLFLPAAAYVHFPS
ncbi:MAG: S41 family peptidase [Anaerolineae bacterium]